MNETTSMQGQRAGVLSAWHAAILPDYNRAATTFWLTMVAAGGAVLGTSVAQLSDLSSVALAQALIGIGCASLAGLFPVHIPRAKNSMAAGEIFMFLLLLLVGPTAATVAAGAEALVAAWRSTRRWSSRICSPALAAVSMFVSASAFEAVRVALLAQGAWSSGALFAALMVFALAYAVLSTGLFSAVTIIKSGKGIPLADWLASFGWIGIAHPASACIAGLIFLSFEQLGLGALLVALPIIAAFVVALHFYMTALEIAERSRRERLEAAEREAAQAARHMFELAASERRFHSAFTHAAIGMALLALDGRIRQVNPALCTLLGVEEAHLLDTDVHQWLAGGESGVLEAQLQRIRNAEVRAFSLDIRCLHRQGHEVWVALHCGRFADGQSAEPCLIMQMQDITARRQAEARLQHIAYHDGLTNLANRGRFMECLAGAIAAAERDPSQQFAVIFLDFDRFKIINDSLGHNVGDEFLTKAAERIRQHLRAGDLVARLGGDEFAILMRPVGSAAQAVALSERLQQALREPVVVGGTEVAASASIGITLSGMGRRTPQEILRDADTAMYKAKANGKANHAVFDASMHTQVSEQLQIERDLHRAIEQDQLSVVFQPMFRLDNRETFGVEALLRWRHPERGPVAPQTFVPVAEESGLIVPLTELVLNKACAELKRLQGADPALASMRLNVNVSARNLRQPGFAGVVAQALLRYGLDPSQLSLELTEGMLMENLDAALDTMNALRRLGVGLCVDDFGTGYSSLSYLSTLPINGLKIDASFVRQLAHSPESAAIVRAIVDLGASLGKMVIAEGIEEPAQTQRLRELGCDLGQGFLLCAALPPDDLAVMLRAMRTPQAVAG
jgi:diguanylate cyclase (GGDEF)-like protein/PAS domain S-box-containing protein